MKIQERIIGYIMYYKNKKGIKWSSFIPDNEFLGRDFSGLVEIIYTHNLLSAYNVWHIYS